MAADRAMALAYLLVVLLGSALQGRVVGLVLSIACFLAFNFFLLPPYYTFALHDPLDWWVLVAFLITGAVAAELFHRSRRALDQSESRARVLDRLVAVGAESLAVPRAVDAVRSIARVLLAELGLSSCRIFIRDLPGVDPIELSESDGPLPPIDPRLVDIAVNDRRTIAVHADGSFHLAPQDAAPSSLLDPIAAVVSFVIPLRVRAAVVGVLVIDQAGGRALDAESARFADALVHHAALLVERVRLTSESEHVGALREADRVKDAVLASVSHDLRTPLTTIRALGSELRRGGDERAATIEEEAERLNRMVGDLLDLSRIRGGALPIERSVIAAEDLVGAALQRLRRFPGAERIRARVPAGDVLPIGCFDFVQALRALVNLLENALQHSAPERSVELEVTEEGDDLVFSVRDRGAGVPEADRERIFEPFVRGDAGSGTRRGAGLGLSIARTVAEVQGGSVRYRPRQGGGSIFELRLPAESAREMS